MKRRQLAAANVLEIGARRTQLPPNNMRIGAAARLFRERVAPVLTWLILTASTVGPGTVTVCSKAGADHGAALLWSTIDVTGRPCSCVLWGRSKRTLPTRLSEDGAARPGGARATPRVDGTDTSALVQLGNANATNGDER